MRQRKSVARLYKDQGWASTVRCRLKFERIFFIFIIFTALYYYKANYWRSVWWDKWFFLMAAQVIFVSFHLGRKYHYIIGIFVGYLLMMALWAFGWRNSYALDLPSILAIGKVTAYTFSAISISILTLVFADLAFYEAARKCFAFLCIFNSLVIIYQLIMKVPTLERGGLFGNPSMSGSFIGFTFPFIASIFRHGLIRLAALMLSVFACLLTGATQPIYILVVTLAALNFPNVLKNRKNLIFHWLAPVIFTLAIASISILYFTGKKYTGPFVMSGRMELWTLIFKWFSSHGHVLFGQGTGISQILVPMIQQNEMMASHALIPGREVQWWMWLHSDWLQLLFEDGMVGFILGVLMYGTALFYALLKADWLFAVVAGIGVSALTNFPAHFPLHAFVAVVSLAMCFDKHYLSKNNYLRKKDGGKNG